MVDDIFLSCGERVFSWEASLHSLLDSWTVFSTASLTIGSVAHINPLNSISDTRGRLFNTFDAVHRESHMLTSSVYNAFHVCTAIYRFLMAVSGFLQPGDMAMAHRLYENRDVSHRHSRHSDSMVGFSIYRSSNGGAG
jgi:hypothetical protein